MTIDLLDLFIKIGVDDQASSEIERVTEKTRGFGSVVKGMLTADAIKAAGRAVVNFGKQAISSFADYEQLIGGVETLFKESADVVQQYAANAYKTAGLSANQYMETVTSFSASLLQSLGGDTAQAASVADMAITDMADNANKMGTSIESIQNAYQGFAKQNYTMLDNLKLGYGGTKEEMERLLADAGKLSGVEYDISNLNDVYEAIHVVQTEMGITGTTALEASETISGSLSAMKGAWQNLVGGLADNNADFDSLLDGFIDSAVTFGKNVLPRISTFLGGASSLIVKGAQEILPIIVDTLTANLPTLIESGIGLVVALTTGLLNAVPDLVASLPEIIMAIVDGLKSAWPQIRDAGINLLNNFADGMWSLRETLLTKGEEFVNKVIEGVQNKFEEIRAAAADIVEKIKEALEEKMDDLKTKGEQVVGKIKEGISSAWEGLKKWFKGLWDGLFGNLTATATINGTTSGKLEAGGMDFVPYNDFPARLHRGEAVLTAREADEWRRGNVGGGGVVVNQYIQSVAQTPVQLASATEAYFEQARWAFS